MTHCPLSDDMVKSWVIRLSDEGRVDVRDRKKNDGCSRSREFVRQQLPYPGQNNATEMVVSEDEVYLAECPVSALAGYEFWWTSGSRPASRVLGEFFKLPQSGDAGGLNKKVAQDAEGPDRLRGLGRAGDLVVCADPSFLDVRRSCAGVSRIFPGRIESGRKRGCALDHRGPSAKSSLLLLAARAPPSIYQLRAAAHQLVLFPPQLAQRGRRRGRHSPHVQVWCSRGCVRLRFHAQFRRSRRLRRASDRCPHLRRLMTL